MFEVFHGTGGHGGPYQSESAAIEAAKAFALNEVRSNSIHAIETIKEYCADGFRLRHVIKAHRCLDCSDVHVCSSPV